MSFVDISGLCSELCLYMASVGYLVSLFGETRAPLWYFGVFFVCGLLCALLRNKKGFLRFVPLVVLAAAFPGADSAAAVILPIPAVFLLALKAKNRVWLADYDRTKSLSSFGFVVLPVDIFAAFVISAFEKMAARALPFFIVWMLLSILNLRMLRSPSVMNAKTRTLNVLLVLLIALAGFGLSRDACVKAALSAASAVYTYAVMPVILAVIIIVSALPVLFAWLLSLLSRLFGGNSGTGESPMLEENMEAIYNTIEQAETPEWLIWLAAALGAAAFVFAVCAVIRRLVGRSGPAVRAPEQPGHAAAAVESVPRRLRRFGKAPADVVRNSYRKYLVLCGKRGIPVDGSAASDDICRMSESLHPGSGAEELRELWLPARFSGGPVSQDDARAAKQALKDIGRQL